MFTEFCNKTRPLYNIIEKDFYSKENRYYLRINTEIDALGVPVNHGWNLPLEDWEVAQLLGN